MTDNRTSFSWVWLHRVPSVQETISVEWTAPLTHNRCFRASNSGRSGFSPLPKLTLQACTLFSFLHLLVFKPFSPSLIKRTLYGYISQQQQKSFFNTNRNMQMHHSAIANDNVSASLIFSRCLYETPECCDGASCLHPWKVNNF